MFTGIFARFRTLFSHSKRKVDFKLKERSYLILTYTLSGFSYFTTAYILKDKPGAVATQIHRLRRRILDADSPHLPLYRQAFPDDAALADNATNNNPADPESAGS